MRYIVLWTCYKAVLESREFRDARAAARCFHKLSLKAGIPSPGAPEGLSEGRNLCNASGLHTVYAFALDPV